MPDSATWAALAAVFGDPADWDERLPRDLADRAAVLGRTRLQTEHTRLFVNGVPGVLCPPYASWYLEGRLVGVHATRLRRLYRRWGVDVGEEAADHIAVQLAFLASLFDSLEAGLPAVGTDGPASAGPSETASWAESAADPGPDAAASDARAMVAALRQWVPEFARRVRAHDQTGFFALAADRCEAAVGPES